jgi:hypothetical protein
MRAPSTATARSGVAWMVSTVGFAQLALRSFSSGCAVPPLIAVEAMCE